MNTGPLALATSALITDTTTLDFQDLHIFPLYCWIIPLAAVTYLTDHLFGVDQEHLLLWRGAIICGTIIKFWPFIYTRLKLSHLKGSGKKKQRKMWLKNFFFNFSLCFLQNPIRWEIFNLVCMKRQNLNCDDKAFSSYGSSLEGEVFLVDTEKVFWRHNWWSVEYETAASGTTQQYKGKMCRF